MIVSCEKEKNEKKDRKKDDTLSTPPLGRQGGRSNVQHIQYIMDDCRAKGPVFGSLEQRSVLNTWDLLRGFGKSFVCTPPRISTSGG